MRNLGAVLDEVYQQNLRTFSDADREAARKAWDTYMFAINGAGLRWEFDYFPSNISKLLERVHHHHRKINYLRAQAQNFEEFIQCLERLGNRSALQLHPQWWQEEDAPDTLARTLDPQTIPTYRTFLAAVNTYLAELGQSNPDWAKVDELARRVAYTINPDDWRQTGVPVTGPGVLRFGTRWYLEAVLAKPVPR